MKVTHFGWITFGEGGSGRVAFWLPTQSLCYVYTIRSSTSKNFHFNINASLRPKLVVFFFVRVSSFRSNVPNADIHFVRVHMQESIFACFMSLSHPVYLFVYIQRNWRRRRRRKRRKKELSICNKLLLPSCQYSSSSLEKANNKKNVRYVHAPSPNDFFIHDTWHIFYGYLTTVW